MLLALILKLTYYQTNKSLFSWSADFGIIIFKLLIECAKNLNLKTHVSLRIKNIRKKSINKSQFMFFTSSLLGSGYSNVKANNTVFELLNENLLCCTYVGVWRPLNVILFNWPILKTLFYKLQQSYLRANLPSCILLSCHNWFISSNSLMKLQLRWAHTHTHILYSQYATLSFRGLVNNAGWSDNNIVLYK